MPREEAAPASAALAAEAALWSEKVTAEGKRFYYNKLTKQRQWKKPEALRAAGVSGAHKPRREGEWQAEELHSSACGAASLSQTCCGRVSMHISHHSLYCTILLY